MKHSKCFIGFLFALLIVPVIFAAEDNLRNHPGYVDLSALTSVASGEPNVEINLKEPLLKMITNILKEHDGPSADFISKLLRVNVRAFVSANIDTARMSESMSEVARGLDSLSWDRVVRVREEGEHVDVYFKLSDNAELIHGIAIMVTGATETVLINIIGDISPNDISALAERFDIDELAGVNFGQGSNNNQ